MIYETHIQGELTLMCRTSLKRKKFLFSNFLFLCNWTTPFHKCPIKDSFSNM